LERYLAPVAVALTAFAALTLASLALFGVGSSAGGGTPMLLVGFVLFQGAGFGVLSILRPTLIAELLGRRRFGTIAGFLAVPFLSAFALAPSLAGFIWARGGYDGVIGAAGAAALIGFVALMLAARNR